MEFINSVLNGILTFTNWVWGYPMMIWLLCGSIFLTAKLGFLQFRKFPFIMKHTIGKAFHEKKQNGKISGWQAVTGALSSTLGAGNIVGVGIAVAYGGPGALFWMWIVGFIVCILKYSEVLMALKFRIKNSRGEWEGGPQYYLSNGTGWKWLGMTYAVVLCAVMFVSASAQIGAGVDNVVALNVNRTVGTTVFTLVAAIVVIGGMKRLLSFTEKIVPFMSILYVGAGLIVIAMNIENLPEVLELIFTTAFTGQASVGGFVGATFVMCVRWGLARGMYSCDAGAGHASITHSVADVNHPVQQAMWGIFEVFFSTIVVCSITGFTVLITGAWLQNPDGSVLVLNAFQSTLGRAGAIIVAVSLILFTFTTACANVAFGSIQLNRIFNEKVGYFGRFIYIVVLYFAGMAGINAIINYMDFGSFLVVFINTIGLYVCYKQIIELSHEYFSNPEKWETTMWQKWQDMEKGVSVDTAVDKEIPATAKKGIVIALGREFGSGGCEIAEKLSAKLGIPYYDKDLITMTAKAKNASIYEVAKADETKAKIWERSVLNKIDTFNDTVFNLQSDIIRDLADKESCIIIGRCADRLLKDRQNCISVFIRADMDFKKQRIAYRFKIAEEDAEEVICKVDTSRQAYYHHYTDGNWGDMSNYDLILNSSKLGIHEVVDSIYRLVTNMQKKELPA